MPSLASLLSAKITAAGLSTAEAADKLDIAAPTMRKLLQGIGAPNARTIPKIADFLRLSEDKVVAIAPQRGSGGKADKTTRAKLPSKPGRKAGRPKLPGVAKATIRLLTKSLASIEKRIGAMHRVIAKIRTN
jgi:transcriptional regulator with XRE-family HTH domain